MRVVSQKRYTKHIYTGRCFVKHGLSKKEVSQKEVAQQRYQCTTTRRFPLACMHTTYLYVCACIHQLDKQEHDRLGHDAPVTS